MKEQAIRRHTFPLSVQQFIRKSFDNSKLLR